MSEFIDVIITSSSRDQIFKTIPSFVDKVKSKRPYRFLLNVDPCGAVLAHEIMKLFSDMNLVYMNINEKPGGFTKAVSSLINRVESEYYFHLEDDWIFLCDINLDLYIDILTNNPDVNHIRFSKRVIRDYNNLFYIKPLQNILKPQKKQCLIDGVPLVKVISYSTNPSLCRASHFKNRFHIKSRNIEQQFSLINFLMLAANGYYIAGKIGDQATVDHIG